MRFAMDNIRIFFYRKKLILEICREESTTFVPVRVFSEIANRTLVHLLPDRQCIIVSQRIRKSHYYYILFLPRVRYLSREYYIKEIGCRKFFAPPAQPGAKVSHIHTSIVIWASLFGWENRVKFPKTLYGRCREVLKFFECSIAAADIVARTRFQDGENHLLRLMKPTAY